MVACLGSVENNSPPDECTIDLGSSLGAVMSLGAEEWYLMQFESGKFAMRRKYIS